MENWSAISKFFLCLWPRPRVINRTAKIKSLLFFYPTAAAAAALITPNIIILSAAAAAAVGVEDKQRFNVGHAAMRPKFGRKRSRLRRKKVEIATPMDNCISYFC